MPTDAQSGGGYRFPKPPRRVDKTPKPSRVFTSPVGPVTIAPPRPVPRPQRLAKALQQLGAPTPRQAAQQDLRRAQDARRQQVVSRARHDILANAGVAPPRVPQFHDSGPRLPQPAHPLFSPHDSGPTVPLPQYRGVSLSPQQIQRDMAAVLHPGSQNKTGAIERLQAAGVVNPYGTTTHRVAVLREQAYRRHLIGYLTRRQLGIQNANTSDLAASPREIAMRLRGMSTSELEKRARYKPTPTQTLGLSIDPTTVSGLIHGTTAGIGMLANAGGTAVNQALGLSKSGIPGRALADLAQFPIQAVPALYDIGKSTVDSKTRKQLLTGLSHGYIGSLIRGDHPSRYFHEHPLFSALELAGGIGGAARLVGATGRSATRGALFGTGRAPLALTDTPNTRLVAMRAYSKDPLRQAAQRFIDARLKPGPTTTIGGRTVQTRLPAAQFIANHELRRIADYVASRANSRERVNRDVMAQTARMAAPVRQHAGGKLGQRVGEAVDRTLQSQPLHGKRVLPQRFYRPERDLVGMVLEGVLRSPETFVADLRKERARIETAYRAGGMDKIDMVANRQRAATIDRVLADPKARANASGVFASAHKLAPEFKSLEREAIRAGVLDAGKASRAKLFPTAMAHQGATYEGALTHDGQVLPTSDIKAMLRDQGGNPDLLTYLPHHYTLRGARAYHQMFGLARKNYEGTHARTGAMFQRGSSPHDYQHVLETLVGQSNKLVNIHEFDRALATSGIKHPDGRYLTAQEAEHWLRNGVDDNGQPLPPGLRAVRAFASKGLDDQALTRIESQQGVIPGQPSTLLEDHFKARTVTPGDPSRARNVVLIPDQIYGRLLQHVQGGRAAIPALQAAQSAFRRTVLPLSTKWLTGNVLEAVLRLGTAGVGPHDPLIGRKLVQRMIALDEHAGRSAEAELVGGLLYGQRGLTVRRSGQEVAGNVGRAVANAPVVHELGSVVRGLTDVPFRLNRAFEREAQFAALGKYARQQMQEMTGSWTKALTAQRQALDDVAKGLLDTPAQVRAARYLDETLGKYNRFSPQLRNVIQTYAPFLPWYLAALRFTLHTLPVKHTLKTAILAKTEATLQGDYEAQKQDLKNFPSLRTAIKTKGGGYIDLARFTPFGLTGPIAAGDLSAIPGVVLPQISGPAMALEGLDPFGQQLQVAKKYGGKGQPLQGGDLAKIAGNALLESFIPGLQLARRLREHGQTALPGSTVFSPKTKGPASSHGQSALDRVFNPVRPVYLKNAPKGQSGELPPDLQGAVDKALGATRSSLPPAVQRAVDRALAGR